MAVPIWVGKYIGIPYLFRGRDRATGLDCWGLTRLIMREEYCIALPSYDTEYQHIRRPGEMHDVVIREKQSWTQVPAGQEVAGDLILLRMQGEPIHVGVVIGDGRFIHVHSGINATHDSYRTLRWRDRIGGFYRYAR